MNKYILGLDLGTNSIGWALIKYNSENRQGGILGMGTRVLPMSQDVLGDFGKGNSVSQTAARTGYRGVRRLRERFLLRRERLHRVLNILGFLPEFYASQIDFDTRFGKFKHETEPRLPYDNEGFIFKTSFEEMLSDFERFQPELLSGNKKVPYDWAIYYLRKKAVSQRIEKEELAWLLLNFNQKRGYYQLRGEELDEEKDKVFVALEIDKVVDSREKVRGKNLYDVYFTNGWKYEKQITKPEDWIGRTKEFIVTESLLKNGEVKRTFKAVDSEKDWIAIKAKTEQEIDSSHKTVGSYIYDTILQNPTQKIKGKLVATIERKFYREELKQILETQKEFHPELRNGDLYIECVRELYRNNEAHQLNLSKKDFVHLFLDDIIFYQRPLRSQKSSVSNCSLEFRKYKDKSGKEYTQYLKVISKSNPYYQEFRIWQWMVNLSIYRKEDDSDVTLDYLNTNEDFEQLFEFLDRRKEIDQKVLLKHFKLNEKTHRWNYVEDKKYPCNETKWMIASRLEKIDHNAVFLTRKIEQELWHLIYSVSDKTEYEKALRSFAKKNNLDENVFFEAFRKFLPFKSEYGAFSEKAIKRLLPFMRLGKFWNWENIDEKSRNRIQKIIDGEYDENISDRIREKTTLLQKESDFQGLPLWLTQYVVYGRHSEASVAGKWNSIDDLEEYLKGFKQHSLRNPIVEQVITETLRVVKDIWQKYGNGVKDFFNEIHIELGREMKLPAEERAKLTRKMTENENTNLRVKALLAEMMYDADVENVRPYSPMQQEILKIYEDGVLNSDISVDEDILKISKTAQPSPSDLKKYKLWLEQKYRSPYTGEIIPLNKLFTSEYEIEHIIPQSRYFDDSFSNKVICESAVNKLKDNYVGLGFIKQFHGYRISDKIKVFEVDEYEDFVKKNYAGNRSKRSKLLLEEIPEEMIERQLNDTRYISKFISCILSNIVRKEKDDDGVNSKDLIPCNGRITSQLKQDWGLNDIWNDLILPRFERMNLLTQSNDFTVWNEKYQKFLPTVPVELSKGFSKKRIDHRHHALDALIIASATRDHVNLLNNQSSKSEIKRYDLKRKLMKFEKKTYKHPQTGERIEKDVPVLFLKPWENLTVEAKGNLEKIIVSFKQDLRVINKATNHCEKWIEKEGVKVKELIKQQGINWAIRKPLHKDTVSGKVELSWIKVPKGKILTATRKMLDSSFDFKTINSITDTGIQKILKNYLEHKGGSSEEAFSAEGVEDMNRNIEKFNNGKPHQPITKARVFELGSKFPLGQTGNKKHKYVETAKGTNLFFAVYEDDKCKRTYETITLNEVIERQKQGLDPVCLKNKNDFYLCPNDLVYIASEGKSVNNLNFQEVTKEDLNNIYRVVSFSGSQIFFVRQEIAISIVNKAEFSTLNKMERAIDGRMIKEACIKLKMDRIGNVIKI